MCADDGLSAYTYRDGYAVVFLMDEDNDFRIPLADFDRVRAEWMRGAAFIDVTTVQGARLTIKGARICQVGCYPADTLAEYRRLRLDQDARDKEDAMLSGGD